MKIILLCIALFSMGQVSAFADDSQISEQRKAAFLNAGHCGKVIRSDENKLYLGFSESLPRDGKSGRVEIVDLHQPGVSQTLKTQDGVVDVAPFEKSLWVLTYSHLEEWDLDTLARLGTYSTYSTLRAYDHKQNPTGMYLHGKELVISHGRLGYAFFNVESHRLVDQKRILTEQLPLESMAVDIAGSGDIALIAVDDYSMTSNPSKEAFRGILTVDLNTHEVVKQLSGLDPGANGIFIHGDDVLVSFHPPVWKYSLSSIVNSRADSIEPEKRIWKFSENGIGIGKPFFDDQNMYACFSQTKQGSHIPVLTPVVMDLKTIGIN